MIKFVFIVCPSGGLRYLFKIEVLAHVKAFLEKKRSGTSLPASFSA